MNAASQITTADLKIVRQWVRSSDKAGALLDTANLQQFREKLWAALQDGLDVKDIRAIVSCLLDTRRMIAINETSQSKERVFRPGEQEEAVFRLFGELPEPDCSAAELLEQDVTGASAAPEE